MTTKVPSATASAVLSLRALILAICRARPDGDELLATLTAGHTRVVFDEREGVITFGVAPSTPGDPVEWLETVTCDPNDEITFGALESSRLLAGGRMH